MGGEIILENLDEVTAQDLEPYSFIFRFIEEDIIPKYPCLTSVFQDNFDEEGNPRIQYYIRYAADLSIDKWRKLRTAIWNSVIAFCKSNDVPFSIYSEIDLIVSVDGEYYEKYHRGF